MGYGLIKHIIASYIFIILAKLSIQSNNDTFVVPRVLVDAFFKEGPVKKLKVTSLVWENCGSPNDPGRLYSLNVKHTPLGDIKASFKVGSVTSINAPVKMVLDVRMKTFGTYVKIPCLKNILGSCTFADLCKFGDTYPICPFKPFRDANFPCQCPLPKGMYDISGEFPNPTTKYANSLTGDISLTAHLTYGGTNHLACYRFNVTLDNPEQIATLPAINVLTMIPWLLVESIHSGIKTVKFIFKSES